MTEKSAQSRPRRVEIFCLTYGEPAEHAFRAQFDYSLSILRRLTLRVAPIPKFVLPLLAARRGLIRVKNFKERGYHSPLEGISAAQAAKVEAILRRKRPDVEFHARMVMEFRAPYIWEHLDKLRADAPDELVILPLYMAESDFTGGISRTDLGDYQRQTEGRHGLPQPAYLNGFGFDERMGAVLAEHVWKHCIDGGWTPEKCRESALILGAHGTLQFPPAGINSGARETIFLFGLIRKHLKDRFKTVRIGWLNHSLGGKWTFPAVDESAKECWDQGLRHVVYFPFGFMGDNAESQVEGRDALAKFQWEDMLYLPCPNDADAFCEVLADKVLERLDDPMREDWNRIEQGGRRDLIQRERPARRGEPGALSFSGPTLAKIGIGIWLAVGVMLLVRGTLVMHLMKEHVGWTLGLYLFAAIFVGYFKGSRIMDRVMKKNLRRLRTIPQPSPLYRVYSKPTYFVIVFFMALGMCLRFAGLYPPLYASILLAVGVAMVWGAVTGIRNFREAIPREIISMHGPPTRRVLEPQRG